MLKSDQKLNIGILEDHKLVMEGYKKLLHDSKRYNVNICSTTAEDFFKKLDNQDIDILLLDLKLKHTNGLDVLKRIKKDNPEVKVIILTMEDGPITINTLIKNGADGFLLKESSPHELLSSIDNVHIYGKYFDIKTTNKIIDRIQNDTKLENMGIHLIQDEKKVLSLLSKGKTNKEIASIVFKSHRTVEGIRQKLLKKTNSKNSAELVSWGYKNKIL